MADRDMALPDGTGSREPSPSVSAVPASIPNAACISCLFWTRNEFREPSPEPETHDTIFGIRFERDPFIVRMEQWRRSQDIYRNQSGLCRRFPKATRTHETYHCGEFAQGMSAGTAETLHAAQGEARQPGPKGAPETGETA